MLWFVESQGLYIQRWRLFCSHRYKRVVSGHLGLAVGAEKMRVLMQKRTIAAWELWQISQVSYGVTLHAQLKTFGFIQWTAWFWPPSAFSYPHMCTVRCFAGHSKIMWSSSMASFCGSAFALLLGEKRHFSTSRFLRLNLMPGRKCRCWISLFWMLFAQLIDLLLRGSTSLIHLLRSFPVSRNIILSTRATIV